MRPLSNRLNALLELVPRCSLAADIGADHGLLTVELLKCGIAAHVVCTDLSAPSLEKARAAVHDAGLSASVTFAVGDGLTALGALRPEAVVIAGMGGETIAEILSGAEDGDTHYLLQPMTRASHLRRALSARGFSILEERLAKDDGRIYPVLHAVPAERKTEISDLEALCGAHHLARCNDALTQEYLCAVKDSIRRRRDGRRRALLETDEEDALLTQLLPYLKPKTEEL